VFANGAPEAAWWRAFDCPLLDGLITEALDGNRDLQQALARIEEARAAAGVAKADLMPRIDGGAGYLRTATTHASPSPLRGVGYDTWSLGFNVSWELDLFGRLRRESEARTAELQIAEADVHAVQLLLVAEVVAAYADLIGARDRRAVADASVAAAEALVSLTRGRTEGGLGTDLDVARADRLLAAARARLPLLERDWHRAAFRLSVLTGRAPGDKLAELRAAPGLGTVPDVIAIGLPAELVRQRPDVRAAEQRLHAATARVGAALAERYPSVNIAGFFGLEANHADRLRNISSHAMRVGPNVRVPLFAGGSITERIRIREAQLQEASFALEQQVLLAFEEVENAATGLQQGQRRRGELGTALAAADRTRVLAQQRFDAGLDDFLAVLDAEQSRLDIADQHALAATEVVRQFAALHRALGGGSTPTGEAVAGPAGD
jgi:NodT family efflux transporter outer membrane factor (OMF) lipoprotein